VGEVPQREPSMSITELCLHRLDFLSALVVQSHILSLPDGTRSGCCAEIFPPASLQLFFSDSKRDSSPRFLPPLLVSALSLAGRGPRVRDCLFLFKRLQLHLGAPRKPCRAAAYRDNPSIHTDNPNHFGTRPPSVLPESNVGDPNERTRMRATQRDAAKRFARDRARARAGAMVGRDEENAAELGGARTYAATNQVRAARTFNEGMGRPGHKALD